MESNNNNNSVPNNQENGTGTKPENEINKNPTEIIKQRKTSILFINKLPFDKQDKYGLLVAVDSREKFNTTIEPLAGTVEDDETFEAAALREAKEETGGFLNFLTEETLQKAPQLFSEETYTFTTKENETKTKNSQRLYYLLYSDDKELVAKCNKKMLECLQDESVAESYKEKRALYYLPLSSLIFQMDATNNLATESKPEQTNDWSCREFNCFDVNGNSIHLRMSRYYYAILYPQINELKKKINELFLNKLGKQNVWEIQK